MGGGDPWAHRYLVMRCATCMWFVEKAVVVEGRSQGAGLGRCRKHAPTMTGYPAVFVDDWCGDHKLDERTFSAPAKEEQRDGRTDQG